MSKANVTCGGCGNEWEYSGLSRDSCFCPNCSRRINLKVPGAGDMVDIIREFGAPDTDRQSV